MANCLHMDMDRDRVLKRRLAEGDETAFSEFYNQHWESLFKYAAGILSNKEETADIVQETFIAFWDARDRAEEIDNLKAYLYIIARNKAFRQLRSSLKKHELLEKFVRFYADVDQQTEHKVNTNDLSAVIDAEISRLPEKMRQIFIMSRKEHLSHNEIAKKLQISDLTVKKQINNALKYLRIRMADDIYYPLIFLFINFFAASTT